MPIIAQTSSKEIRFTIWGAICQRISNWEFTLDEMVFDEQLTTGSFRGKYRVDDDIDWMRAAQIVKAKGKIMPYYGAGGSRGACGYTLRRNDSGYTVNVENVTVKESFEFHDRATDKREPFKAYLQTWAAVNLKLGKVAKPYLIFKINGKELSNLRNWEHWNKTQALTSRYVYRFGLVSMGRLGYTICLDDIQSGEEINITDYANW